MIEAFQYINKAFESKVRLGIMAILMVNEEADFNFLKEQLSLTDGNLASHTRALEELGYIVCNKSFVGRKPRTVFQATPQGREAFKSHIEALEKFLKSKEIIHQNTTGLWTLSMKIQMNNRRSNLWDASTVSPKQSRLSSSDY